MQYETVIGIEVHVELSTKSKIFCNCPVSFGAEPNICSCPVCAGLPGALPVFNKKVLEYAIMAGIATNCSISNYTEFDRKNYFYPDLPKAYQISQLYHPICTNGYLEIEDATGRSKHIGIREIHIEEDAGKLIHDPWDDATLIDFNRCGVPLLEIVSNPDISSAQEAISYLNKLKSTIQFLGISDCKMQEGSFRADINLSVRPIGEKKYGTRTEMKNLNSMKSVSRAIEKETIRQIELLNEGKTVIQETRRWDDNKDASFSMRSKENAQDYRYFPDPDLPAIVVNKDMLDYIKSILPEFYEDKRRKYINDFKLSESDTDVITSERKLSELLDDCIKAGIEAKEAVNWIRGDFLKILNESNIASDSFQINTNDFIELINLCRDNKINRNSARIILKEMMQTRISPELFAKENNLLMANNDNEVFAIVSTVLSENKQSVADYLNGKDKALSYLVGQTMRQLRGKGNPSIVTRILTDELNKL